MHPFGLEAAVMFKIFNTLSGRDTEQSQLPTPIHGHTDYLQGQMPAGMLRSLLVQGRSYGVRPEEELGGSGNDYVVNGMETFVF